MNCDMLIVNFYQIHIFNYTVLWFIPVHLSQIGIDLPNQEYPILNSRRIIMIIVAYLT